MATTFYFEEKLYPVNDDGRADKTQSPNTVAVFVSNFSNDHQIYLRITDENNQEKTFHLTKEQAKDLSESADRAENYIAYDNS
ncbi:MAG: hypothetical protein C0623_13605 [Desulfuromonas sp.]|nr:MAG: hypothetical protein C0623_13605 [Desulfuromonas sp.]